MLIFGLIFGSCNCKESQFIAKKLTLGKYIENLAHIWWFGFLRPPPQNRLLAASSRCNHPSAAPGKCCNHRTLPLVHRCNHRTVPLIHWCNHHTVPLVHWYNHHTEPSVHCCIDCIVPLLHYSNHHTVCLVHWCNGCCTIFDTLLQCKHHTAPLIFVILALSAVHFVTVLQQLHCPSSTLPQSLHCPQRIMYYYRNHHTGHWQTGIIALSSSQICIIQPTFIK